MEKMKTYKNLNNEIVSLTENEIKVIDEMENMDNPEYFFSSELNCLPGKTIRGVLSSLEKKQMIDINAEDGGLISKFYTIVANFEKGDIIININSLGTTVARLMSEPNNHAQVKVLYTNNMCNGKPGDTFIAELSFWTKIYTNI